MTLPVFKFELAPQERARIIGNALQRLPYVGRQPGLGIVLFDGT